MRTHLNMGPTRSGTWSLWRELIKHPEIHSPGWKEIHDLVSLEYYVSQFNNEQGVHIDATPTLHKKRWFPKLIKKLNDHFDRTAFIYIKRNQFDHWLSQLTHGLYITKNIKFEDLETVIKNLQPHEYFINYLFEIYGKDLLVLDFLDTEPITEFLKIEDFEFKLEHHNSFLDLITAKSNIETIKKERKMGRMKKEHKEIVEYKLTLTYVCPITKEDVTVELSEYDLSSSESPCDLCGGHGNITIDIPATCPSCKKYHNDITWKSW